MYERKLQPMVNSMMLLFQCCRVDLVVTPPQKMSCWVTLPDEPTPFRHQSSVRWRFQPGSGRKMSAGPRPANPGKETRPLGSFSGNLIDLWRWVAAWVQLGAAGRCRWLPQSVWSLVSSTECV